MPQEPLQKTWPTQPFPEGDTLVLRVLPPPAPVSLLQLQIGLLVHTTPLQLVVQSPGTGGGADWSTISYDPRTS